MGKKLFLCYTLLIAIFSSSDAQHPSLYFTAQDTAGLRALWKSHSSSFPQKEFKDLLMRNRWTGELSAPVDMTEKADYDREKAKKAKAFAFRYLMEGDPVDGDLAFDYLLTKYAADKYIYQADNYARWMTNGLALIDYCAAFDFLSGAGYFNASSHTGTGTHDDAWWNAQRASIVLNLHDKAAAIYNRVRTARSGSDAFSAQLFGNQSILNEVKFHAQVGNHRIITASALGVAAYTLRTHYPSSETGPWLEYARKDVEHFLLNREKYGPLTDNLLRVLTQNISGAFPEGMEYLNYSAEGFVPFMIASKANGGEEYAKDPNFKALMDWVYDLQAPDGSAPQINSTGYTVFPINSLFAESIPGRSHYLAQLSAYIAAYGAGNTSPVEAFLLLKSAASAEANPFDPVTVTASRGEIVMRNDAAHPTRYVLISVKNGQARSAAELHGYADAGSYIFATDRTMLVRHPGYAGYSASRELESAASHSTVSPVVNGSAVYDAPNRDQALPPSADAAILRTKATTNFAYAHVSMELNGPRNVSNSDIMSLNSSILSLRYEYISSNWMVSRLNMTNYGVCERQFLLVNNDYLIVVDNAVRTNGALQFAVSSIQGNNGNNSTRETAFAGAQANGAGETIWTSGTRDALRANVTASGGAEPKYSGFDIGVHQSPDPSNPGSARVNYYHAALRTAAPFIDGSARIVSVLEVDPASGQRSSVTARRIIDGIPEAIAYTVDGRKRTYGRYDIIVSQHGRRTVSFPAGDLRYPVSTDARFLVMSFPETMAAGVQDVKLFAQNATVVKYGPYTFTPEDSGDAQTAFTVTMDVSTSVPNAGTAPAFMLAQNYPNPFNPVARIPYALPNGGHVVLTVHDLLGREVMRLVDGYQEAGAHEAVIDASRLAGGAYVYRLRAGNSITARVMTLVK